MPLTFQDGAGGDTWRETTGSTARPSGATLARFSARGVTPSTSRGSAQGACARVLHADNHQQRQINSSRSYRFFAVAHEPVAIGIISSTRPAESFFFNEFVRISAYIFILHASFFPYFDLKNGSFPPIEIYTGVPLAPSPQISLKNHYKNDIFKSSCVRAFCNPRKRLLTEGSNFKAIGFQGD
jgi:hypothetical protein